MSEKHEPAPTADDVPEPDSEAPERTRAAEAPPDSQPGEMPPKLDPEALELRTSPPRAIRFKREVIIGGAAAASLTLAGVAWLALTPHVFTPAPKAEENPQPATGAASDELADLPESYADIPKLGPPLPGDLGRPILNARERALAGETASGSPAEDAARAAREKQAARLEAARRSALMITGPQADHLDETPRGTKAATSMPAPQQPALDISKGQDREAQFGAGLDTGGDVNPHRLSRPPSSNLLSAGSVISASLLTGLNSDLPGIVIAQVTENVFDSATGRILLVPQGARLVGRYDSVVAYGQKRALVVWQRLTMPDGSSLRLDNMPASDPSGFSGLADEVDFHSWRLIKGAAIASLLGIGSELSVSGESDLAEAIRESAQSNVSRAGDQLTRRNLDIQPTITVRPGAAVRLIVQRDLILAPWKGEMVP